MALPVIRHAHVYVDGLKIGLAKTTTYDLSTNNQSQVGAEGYVGHSIGAKLTKVEFDEIVPASGIRSNLIRGYLMKDKSAVVGYFAGGELYLQDMMCTQATISGESLNGTLACKVVMEGGKPEISLEPQR